MTEVSSAMYSHSLVIFPKDMSHFSIICKEYEKSKILFCGQLELDIKKKKIGVMLITVSHFLGRRKEQTLAADLLLWKPWTYCWLKKQILIAAENNGDLVAGLKRKAFPLYALRSIKELPALISWRLLFVSTIFYFKC